MKDGAKFEPASEREEESFHALCCEDCERDKDFREGEEFGLGCQILIDLATGKYIQVLSVPRIEYKLPKEWIWKDGLPTCKAYVRPGEIVFHEDDLTLLLFAEELL